MSRRAEALRRRLTAQLEEKGFLTGARLRRAFDRVPRHLFLPGVALEEAYADEAVVTQRQAGQPTSSASQPSMVAIMLHQLDLAPGQRVLEIGTGTGYNAALMKELVGPNGRVVSLEIDPLLVERARRSLAQAGADEVRVEVGDGGSGFEGEAPYDRIIVTVGAWDVSPHWWAQLADGGRLVLPLWVRGLQVSCAFHKEGGSLRSRSASPCGFLEMRGAFAGRGGRVEVGQLVLAVEDVTAASAPDGLPGAPELVPGPEAAFGVARERLGLYMAVSRPASARLLSPRRWAGYGLLMPDGLTILPWWSEDRLRWGGPEAERALEAALGEWLDRGQPGYRRLRITAYGRGEEPPLPEGLWRLEKISTTLHLGYA